MSPARRRSLRRPAPEMPQHDEGSADRGTTQLPPADDASPAEPLSDAKLVRASGLFDEAYYLRHHPEVAESGIDPVRHYLRVGAAMGFDPSQEFSTTAYLETNGDVAKKRLNPLVHYLRSGRDEGRLMNPWSVVREQVLESGWFDEDYYRHFADIDDDEDAVYHFLRHSRTALTDPCERFSTSGYLRAYPDTALSTTHPLVHYLRHGRSEGRAVPPGRARWPLASALRAEVWAQVAPLRLASVASGNPRVTVMVESLEPARFFDRSAQGVALAVELANATNASLRLCTRGDDLDAAVIEALLTATGLQLDGGLEVDTAELQGDRALLVGPDELLVVADWRCAAAAMGSTMAPERIVWVVSDDARSGLFGDERLMADETYRHPGASRVVVGDALLQHLRETGGLPDGETLVVSTDLLATVDPADWNADGPPERRLPESDLPVFYFHCEPERPDNLFWRGTEVIEAAIERGVLDPAAWQLAIVGHRVPDLSFPGGLRPEVLDALSWRELLRTRRGASLALVLVDQPYATSPILDLLAGSTAVVTNQRAGLPQHDRLVVSDLTVDALVEGLRTAAARALAPPDASSDTGCDWAQSLAPAVQAVVARARMDHSVR